MPNKSVLIVAYHFPPIQGSTGISRSLAFARYLHQYGWEVRILTIDPRAYEDTSDENLGLIPSQIRVDRAWGLNARRSFAVRGRYPLALAVPDRWQSWIIGGFLKGIGITRAWSPNVVMSTYPIPSAHVIGRLLSWYRGIPWVAEFRDPMLQPDYPSTNLERWSFKMIEKSVFAHASAVVVTTAGCRRTYIDRFPHYDKARLRVISNGYDPALFDEVRETELRTSASELTVLHSGLLYPHERNPNNFFQALRSLKKQGFFDRIKLEFRFRASGNEASYREQVERLGIDSLVTFMPRIPYTDALQEMRDASALMLFQAESCNSQIPAKVYEYLYSRKPILAIADPAGDTGALLAKLGVESIARLEDRGRIEAVVKEFIENLHEDRSYVVPEPLVAGYSREALSGDLGQLLDEITSVSYMR